MKLRFSRARRRGAPAHRRHGCEALESRCLLAAAPLTFAVIGDYGFPAGRDEQVASLVKGWDPAVVLTVGDNNYPTGSADTIDYNIGRLYHDYIYNYRGAFGAGSPTRRFLPALGNHDWGEPVTNPDGVGAYTNYFDLPGNERYYDFAAGPVHFFAIDSDRNEPDGVSADSVQGRWLRDAMAAATEPWKIVYFHHPPYSSGHFHGSDTYMRWPFKGWGASAVFTGHDHDYERLSVHGLPYFVNGLGGGERTLFAHPRGEFTEARFDGGYGAMRVRATDAAMHFEFVDTAGSIIDSYTIDRPGPGATPPAPPSGLVARGGSDGRVDLAWSDNSGSETGFEIERSVDGGWRYDHLTTVDIGSTRYADRSVSADTTYRYRVRAVNGAGASAFSEPAQARTLGLVPLVAAGSVWKYRADGTDLGAAWRAPAFDDAAWASGPAELGYGDGNEVTVVPFGSPDNRFVTTYFRRAFSAPAGTPAPSELRLSLRVDDGAVIYLNGEEIHRWNMPAGPVNSFTRASHGVWIEEEIEWRQVELPGTLLRPGVNQLAVEVHQFSVDQRPRDEADLSFDLALAGSVDDSGPAASLAPPPPVVGGASAYTFDVTYGDDIAMRALAPGSRDVLVTGPNAFSQRAVLLRAAGTPDGRNILATYGITAPGGAWDGADAGVYTVSVAGDAAPGGVRDISGNSVSAGELGTFAWAVAPAVLTGRFFSDINLNGAPGAGEPPLAGRRVYLDGNANGVFDAGEPTATTGTDGVYAFPGLAPGTYRPRPLPEPDWGITGAPAAGGYTVPLAAGQISGGNDFGAARGATVSGFTAVDVNGNGYVGAGDVFSPGQTVYIDLNENGRPDAGETTVSDAIGYFAFALPGPGTYLLRQVLPPGWRPTVPMESGLHVLNVGAGEAATYNFLAATPTTVAPGGPYFVTQGGSVTLSAAGSTAPGTTIRWYEWDFDYDGATFTPDTGRTQSPQAVLSAVGSAGAGTTRALAVRVYDALGNTAVGVTSLRVVNLTPVVDAGPDGRVALGSASRLAGSFVDLGADPWTATVDWGDGGGTQPLPIDANNRFASEHVYPRPGTYVATVTVSDGRGGAGSDTAVMQVLPSGVMRRLVFYRNSAFANRDVAGAGTDAGVADDRAIAPDKRPLLPGQAATIANITGYVRGINGLMVDIGRPTGSANATAADFAFQLGTGGDPTSWPAAPAPLLVTTRPGAGVDGSDRVTVAWADGAIRDQWLRVTVRAGAGTGLARDDVFYFGNLAGNVDAAPDATDPQALKVTPFDLAAIRRRLFSKAWVNSPFDLNRDGRVSSLDLAACSTNLQHTLPLIAAPPAAAAAITAGVVIDVPILAAAETARLQQQDDSKTITASLLNTSGPALAKDH